MKNPARFLLFAFCFLLFAATPVKAQTSEPVPNNLHNYTQQVLLDLSSALTCQLVGIDPTGGKCLAYDVTGKLGFVGPAPRSPAEGGGEVGGAVGTMGNLIAVLYTPPASTGDYFRYLADNFGIVKPALAAGPGIGFKGLSPLLEVWTVFRNLAYVLFVIAFIVIGFAIMLRVRIDPRTVMTIQNQIPKLIIALLLVTFSFAIAGFLIDMMYVVIYLFFNIANQVDPSIGGFVNKINEPPIGFVNELFKIPVIGGIIGIAGKAGAAMQQIISSLFAPRDFAETFKFRGLATSGECIGFNPPCIIFTQLTGETIGTILSQVFGWIISWVVGILAVIVIIIAVLWALFRLWFTLIMAYVYILVDVIFAPLWILTGVLPGGLGFGSWLRDIVANLSAFPTTIGMFLLGKIFIDEFSKSVPERFVPPLIGNPGDVNAIGALIGLGIILMTPQVVNMTKEAFKAPQFKYAAAIGQAVGVGPGLLGGAFGLAMQGLMIRTYTKGFLWGKEGLEGAAKQAGEVSSPTKGAGQS